MPVIKVQWRKIWRDLTSDKIRTLLAVISIAVGVFAVSTVLRTRAILARELNDGYLAVNPASARIHLSPFQEDFVRATQRVDTVQVAEGYTQLIVDIRNGPQSRFECQIDALSNFDTMAIDRLIPVRGSLTPPKGTILIERSALDFIKADLGEMVEVVTEADKTVELEVAGIVNDPTKYPTAYNQTAFGYITFDTLEMLGYPRHLQVLRLIASGDRTNEDYILQVVGQISDEAERAGLIVYEKDIPEPGRHPLYNLIQSLLLILGAMSMLAPLLSIFLTTNTVSALLVRQISQIGIMKTIGAQKWRILALYATMVLIFGLLAWAISIPLAALTARALARFLASLMNLDIVSYAIPPEVWIVEIGISLIFPLLAALFPIVRGARVTIHDAIGNRRGLNAQFGTNAIDRLLGRVRGFNAAFLYSLRNILRRKARFGLTLLALSTVSAIFVTIVSTRLSLLRSVDNIEAYWQEDITLRLKRSYRTERVERMLSQIPGIVYIEPLTVISVYRLTPNGSESPRNFYVAGSLARSKFIQPTLLKGRWLRSEDQNEIVINIDLLNQEPDLEIGSQISFKIKGRTTSWRIVGLVTSRVINIGGDRPFPPLGYVNHPYLVKMMHEEHVTDLVLVETERHTPSYHDEIGQIISDHLERNNIRVEKYPTYSFKRSSLEATINAIVFLFMAMVVLFAVIGTLGLASMMWMNVLERRREIGIIRALGAPRWIIMQIVIVEGIIVGVLSWGLGSLIAIPLSKLLSDTVGVVFFRAPLDYTFSITGVFIWLVMVVTISALASFVPARTASGLSIAEVLMYE